MAERVDYLSMKVEKNSKVEPKRQTISPPVGQRVIVITADFSCLGCLGRDGKWRSFYTDQPLAKVIDWEPV